MKTKIIKIIAACLLSGLSQAEMQALDDDALSGSTAQGITLSGKFSLNENGGPLWRAPDGNCPASTNNGECGTRIAIQGDEDSGWVILDIFQGSLAFGSYADSDPMVLSVEERQIADDPNTPVNEARSVDVISASYEGRFEYENLSLKIASQPVNQGPEPGSSQRDLMSLNFNGYSTFTVTFLYSRWTETMNGIMKTAFFIALVFVPYQLAFGELESLDDEHLSSETGQAGVTIEYTTKLVKGTDDQPQNNIRWKSNDSDPDTFIELQNVYTGDGSEGAGNAGLSMVTKIDVIEKTGSGSNSGSFLVLDSVAEAEKINIGGVNLGNDTALHSVQIFNPSLRAQMEIGAQ